MTDPSGQTAHSETNTVGAANPHPVYLWQDPLSVGGQEFVAAPKWDIDDTCCSTIRSDSVPDENDKFAGRRSPKHLGVIFAEGHDPARCPTPAGSRVLIHIPMEQKTKSGLHIPEIAQNNSAFLSVVAQVVALGPMAYDDMPEPFCAPGDWVLIGLYAGNRLVVVDEKGRHERYRMIQDVDIIGIIPDPALIRHDSGK